VICFSLTYLFYALANIFFIPNSTTVSPRAAGTQYSGIKKTTLNTNHRTLSYFRLGERSIIDEDQLNSGKSIPVYFTLPFNKWNAFKLKTYFVYASKAIIHNYRHSYLSFCILRI
jgi:hypothetical protein